MRKQASNPERCHVDVAADGIEAVRRTRQLEHDIVFMDLGMPHTNGWDAIREIRKGRAAPPYIIAVSAYEDAEARREAFDAGCTEYIVKPLDVRGAVRAFVYRNALATCGVRPWIASGLDPLEPRASSTGGWTSRALERRSSELIDR